MAEKTVAKNNSLRDDLIKQFNAQFKESPMEIMSESDLAKVPGWITTGNYALNWIISKDIFKGLPMGRVTLLTGNAGSGKSMIALSMMREPSIDLIVYMDSEGGGISKEFADFLGIDASKILYQPIGTIEDLKERMGLVIDIIEKNKNKKNVLMVVDSISMLTTERELDGSGGADMGNKAKQTREFFRSYIRKMQKLNIACVITGHLTKTIGGYGPSEEVAGGTILQYAPSAEVRFAKVNADSEIEKSAKGASMIKIRAVIQKSRFGTLGKRVCFDLDMERGLDPYAGLFDILRDYGMITPVLKDWDAQQAEQKIGKSSTGWWAFVPWQNKKLKEIYDKMITEGLTKSGKWREKQLKEFCRDHEWFMHEIQDCLQSIYDEEPEIEEIIEDKEAFEAIAEEVKAIEEIKIEKPIPVSGELVDENEKPKISSKKKKTIDKEA